MGQTSASGTVGAGQLDPEDSNSDFHVMMFMIAQQIALLETMMPVQVHAVHLGSGSPPTAGTVDVQPLVSLLDGSGNAASRGIVYGVPFYRMQGASWAIVCDPAAGDFGYIVSASRDTSNVVKSPGIQNPGSFRQYSFSDGVYVGGCLNAVPPASVWLKADGSFTIKDKFGNQIVSSSTGLTMIDVNGNQMQMKAGAVNFVTTALQVNGVPVTVP
jgi:hypothetical protein